MKSVWVGFALFTSALLYLGYHFGSAIAPSVCLHDGCSFAVTFICAAFFPTVGFFLIACLISPQRSPEICQNCCSLTTDCASDVVCLMVFDHLI